MSEINTSTDLPRLPKVLHRIALWGMVGLAVAVSMGAALISLFKLWVLVAALGIVMVQWCGGPKLQPTLWPSSMKWMMALWAWMLLSSLWSPAVPHEQWLAFERYSRLLVLPITWYVLRWTQMHDSVLKGFVLGQLSVIVSSYMMILGMPVPWATAKDPIQLGIVFTSTLEQPIMMGLFALILFFKFESLWGARRNKLKWILIGLGLTHIFIFSYGRTGYLIGMLVLSTIILRVVPPKHRWTAIVLPILALSLAMVASSTTRARIVSALSDVQLYFIDRQKSEEEFVGQQVRLDYWARSLQMIQTNPISGVGLGQWSSQYLQLGGLHKPPPSNPHQQFLLMATEGGIVALALLVAWMALLWQSAATTASPSAMKGVVLLAVVVSLFNCPFYGVGMGEMLLLLFATLLQPRAHQA